MSIPDLSRAQWRTSSHSSGNGACVQVATIPGRVIVVRDSKNPTGPSLSISTWAWDSFLRATKERPHHL